ncbi:MAG: lipopolysaccharide kinase InaA family protein [Myxococcota bacterium]
MEWLAGDPQRREALEPVLERLGRGEAVTWIRQRLGRRSLAQGTLPDGTPCFLKLYLSNPKHPWRDAWKRRLHLSTPEREWRTAMRLRAAGVRVPEPWAHVRLDTGQDVLVTEWIEGHPLDAALRTTPTERHALLHQVGELVRELHAAGFAHRDLHRENVLIAEGVPWLIDLQAVTRLATPRLQLRDLGHLDHSLRRTLSFPDRVRLRAAALALERPFDERARQQLRAVGRASLSRARRHARSRAARSLRPGRRARRFEVAGGTGLIDRELDAAAVESALSAEPARDDGLELAVFPGGPGDLWRGSAARRAWEAAHALEASDIPHIRPRAFVEWRRLGWPVRSALVMDREARAALPAEDALDAETTLWIQLHESGFRTPGLEGAPPQVFALADGAAAAVADLTRVQFAGRLTNTERRESFHALQHRWQASGIGEQALHRAQQRYSRRLPLSIEALRRDALRERVRKR